MKILDGRREFYQWDVNVKITSNRFKAGGTVHFHNGDASEALSVIAYEYYGQIVADVPNNMLWTARPIMVYIYEQEDDSSKTIHAQAFKVIARPKPADYIYFEPKASLTVKGLVSDAIQAAKMNGDWGVVQTLGTGENVAISQKAVTELLTETGINLYDASKQTADTISPHYYVDGIPNANTSFDTEYNCTAPIEVRPNTTYSIGYVPAIGSMVKPWDTAQEGVFFYAGDGTYISNTAEGTFTTPSNAKYIRFNYYMRVAGYSSALVAMSLRLMLVKGDALPTSYEAYYSKPILEKVGESIAEIDAKVTENREQIDQQSKGTNDLIKKLAMLSKYTDEGVEVQKGFYSIAGAFVSNGSYTSHKLAVKQNDICKITCVTPASKDFAMCNFYDSEMNIIGFVNQNVEASNVTYLEEIVTVPVGACYITITSYTFNNAGSLYKATFEPNVDKTEIVQTLGDKEDAVMSQKAVTEALSNTDNLDVMQEIDKLNAELRIPEIIAEGVVEASSPAYGTLTIAEGISLEKGKKYKFKCDTMASIEAYTAYFRLYCEDNTKYQELILSQTATRKALDFTADNDYNNMRLIVLFSQAKGVTATTSIIVDDGKERMSDTVDRHENQINEVVTTFDNGLSDMIYDRSLNLYDASKQTADTIAPHFYVDGIPNANTNFDTEYNCTAPIEVRPNTTYSIGYVPAIGSMVKPWNTAQEGVFFYDSKNNYISKTAEGTFTTPSNAKYIRFNYYMRVAGYGSALQALGTRLMLVKGDALPTSYVAYHSQTMDEKFDAFFDEVTSINTRLSGKVIVNFGDSIFGNARPPEDISTRLAELTGATVHNCGFGGCRMSYHPYANYDAFSMTKLADAIANNDFSVQDTAISNTEGESLPNYFAESAELLKSIDFSKVDIITIAYGTNDFNEVTLDDEETPLNQRTFGGALRYSVETILTAYPHIRIFICSPSYRFWMDSEYAFIDDSDTKVNVKGYTTVSLLEKAREVAKAYKLPFIDNYYEVGINKLNRQYYFPATDGVHHNINGRRLLAEHIAKSIY